MENRKQEVKPSIADTHGAQPDSSRRLTDYQFISDNNCALLPTLIVW